MTLNEFFAAHPKCALGFSGGVDSTYLLAVALETLGKENVLPLLEKELAAGAEPFALVQDVLIPAITEVGTRYERREYFRISTRDTGVIYNCMRGDDILDMEEESTDYNGLKVHLVDISLGGLMFCTREEFKVNDRFNIVIPAMGDSMLFICEVRRRVERPEGGYGYGCEFVEMATKQEDLLYRYILRRQGDQLRRIR